MQYFITVEGDEFTGKTTVVVPGLERVFQALGFDTLASREPGGSAKGEKLRQTIFEKLREGIPPSEQAVLFNEARQVHIQDTITPFLEKDNGTDKVVILDRYLDSTRVYQGFEGKVPFHTLYELESRYVKDMYPDVTIILYFPEKHFMNAINGRQLNALEERRKANEIIPFDEASVEKHKERHRNFLKLPELALRNNEKRKFIEVNASNTPYAVMYEVVSSLFTTVSSLNSLKKKALGLVY